MEFEKNNDEIPNTGTAKTDPVTPETKSLDQSENQSTGSYIWEVIKFFILAVVIVAPIRFFVAQPFIVQGASMNPTFATGQYLIIDELSYRFNEPERGDVVVLRFPRNPSRFFIKRLVGLPGETLDIKNGVISITTAENAEPFILEEPYVTFLKTDGGDDEIVKLKEGEYFVMGDNRPNSSDSRDWGILPENLIIGKAFLRLFPIDTISFSPGQNFD